MKERNVSTAAGHEYGLDAHAGAEETHTKREHHQAQGDAAEDRQCDDAAVGALEFRVVVMLLFHRESERSTGGSAVAEEAGAERQDHQGEDDASNSHQGHEAAALLASGHLGAREFRVVLAFQHEPILSWPLRRSGEG